ncbi:autophagy protein Apg6-domain-containing protein [Vararia minispora EC-137]|uniref:Autophagy protein Apg6-domain-containing protein n=1 Tax=Vararia minispora EC-137 TaxID=1314806 RepID=A0ACB8QZ14_9AGAM|nr:autophagy protein Apg6-domain-containing protein [Vararia minispora EC-137]
MAFLCQQCKQPLQLDASLVDLAPSAYDMIVGSLPPQSPSHPPPADESEQLAHLPASPAMKAIWRAAVENGGSPARTTLSPRAQGKLPVRSPIGLPNESFVLLQDSAIRSIPTHPSPPRAKNASGPSKVVVNGKPPELPFVPDHPSSPLSHHLRSTQRLLNVLSSQTDIDHPLCSECTHALLTTLSRQLDETKKERDGYIAFEKEVKREKEREKDGIQKEEAEKRIRELDEEERVAIEQLRAAERERAQLEEEMRALELEEKALEEEEDEFWRVHNAQLLKAGEQSSQLAGLRAAYAADSATLERLERTNVYNDAFCIGHDGPFGTINNLRLGRVAGVPVEWAEINAAWGQTLLLLYTITRKLDFTFENYRLVPMGSFSRIERTTGDKATYELYGSGDLHLGRLLHNRRFDFAMVAFLECLKQIMDWAKSQDSTLEFPHQIVKDKIGESSIKLQFSQEEAWTRALRHVLLALKILLKWTTNGSNG